MMKKKIIVASMVSAVALLTAPVQASEQSTIDYDSMSVEDLIALRDEINSKIAEKGGDNILPVGKYEVGKDIKAGQYKVFGCEGYDTSAFNIYSSKADLDSRESSIYGSAHYEENDYAMMNLHDGEYLDVFYGPFVVEEITNASWMPDKE